MNKIIAHFNDPRIWIAVICMPFVIRNLFKEYKNDKNRHSYPYALLKYSGIGIFFISLILLVVLSFFKSMILAGICLLFMGIGGMMGAMGYYRLLHLYPSSDEAEKDYPKLVSKMRMLFGISAYFILFSMFLLIVEYFQLWDY